MAPTRTCVGCRRRDTTDRLVRVVRRGDDIVIDQARTAPGRGAYLHRDPQCVSVALARQSIIRALRGPVTLDTRALATLVSRSTDDRHNGSSNDHHHGSVQQMNARK